MTQGGIFDCQFHGEKYDPAEIFLSRDNKNLTKLGVLFDTVFRVRCGPIKTMETSNLPWFEGSKDRRALWSCETLAAQGNAQVNCSRLLGILYESILIYIKIRNTMIKPTTPLISGLPNRLNPPRTDPELSKRPPSEAAPAIAGYPITRPRSAISPLGG